MKTILEFKSDDDSASNKQEESKEAAAKNAGIDLQLQKRIKASKNLIRELKSLFGFMAQSNKKYADPTGVLKSIVDDFGNPIEIGD